SPVLRRIPVEPPSLSDSSVAFIPQCLDQSGMDVRLGIDGGETLVEVLETCELRHSINHPGVRTWIFNLKLQRKPLMGDAVSHRIGVKILADAGRGQKQHSHRPLRRPIGSLHFHNAKVCRGRWTKLSCIKIEHLADGFGHRRYNISRGLYCTDRNI